MLLDKESGYLSDSLGVSPDQIKVILLLVLSIPLSLVFPFLPSTTRSSAQYFYSLLPSVVFLCLTLNLRKGFLELVLDCLATWTIVKLGVKAKWGKTMPWLVFAVVMGHLAINHILRQIEGNDGLSEIEITGSQMVLTMKLISFAWSVYDGQLPLEKLDKTQQASRIENVPNLLQFMGYCLFFPSILAGPSYTYRSYDSFTSKRLYLKETSTTKIPEQITSKEIPKGRKRKAMKRFITALVFLGIYSTYGGQFGMDRLLEGKFVAKRSLLQRIGFMNLAGFVARTKYYAVWCMAETAFIIAGLGYNPQTNHYDASRNVRISSIELAPNFKIFLDSWNMNTNVWLRECIYKRVAKTGKKPGFKSTQITFITSALWHGFNPCYLLTFVLGGFAQSLGRLLRNHVRPFFLPPGSTTTSPSRATPAPIPSLKLDPSKPVTAPLEKVKILPPPQTPLKSAYDVLGIVSTQLVLNFAVTPFLLLDVPKTLAAWKTVGWYGLIMVFVPTFLFNAGLAKELKMRIRRRDAKEQRTKEEEESEKKRLEWEKAEEEKRVRRGEGVPGIGMDVERMMDEEEKLAKLEKKE
ncbi:lysophospholipid acyltransferase [Sporobolomyces salmoneus]|uniref:lysophospholipid acyltransferase n=1 Tax=Sporobolomyces salmoneus TaxID=183962 RepID=UPI003175448C